MNISFKKKKIDLRTDNSGKEKLCKYWFGRYQTTRGLLVINITIYFYNRQLLNYKKLIWKKYIKLFKHMKLRNKINKKLLLIKNNGLKFLKKQNIQKNILI